MFETLVLKAALGKAKDYALGAIKWVAEYPWQSACIALVAWLAWLHIFTLPGLHADVEREAASHRQTKADYTTAQEYVAQQWEADTAQWEQDRKENADEADKRELEARSAALDLAERFIARNRVQCPAREAVASAPSAAARTAESSDTQGDQRSGDVPLMDGVLVPAEDVRICTINTTRLQAARQWSATLE